MSSLKKMLLLAIDLEATVADVRPIAELALAIDADVEVLLVTAPELGYFGFSQSDGGDADVPPTHDRTAATAVLASVSAAIEALGVGCKSVLLTGPTIETIIGRADAIDALMIAIIGRRHSLGHRLVMGSVGQSLLKYSHRPVLVVPAAANDNVDSGLLAAIDQMIHVLDRTEVDGEFADLRSAAEAKRNAPDSDADSHHLLDRLRDPAYRFETDHPALVRAVNDVAYYLSGMGL